MNLNNASAEQLEEAFQVDGTRARYLIEQRNKLGSFTSWEQVKQVPGFEDKMVENLRNAGLTIGTGSRGDGDCCARTGRRENSRSGRGFDLNSASAEDLDRVFQIDGERASYLLDARKRLGKFTSWEQVKSEVPSFDDGMIENLKNSGAVFPDQAVYLKRGSRCRKSGPLHQQLTGTPSGITSLQADRRTKRGARRCPSLR